MSDDTVSDLYLDAHLAAFYDIGQAKRHDFEFSGVWPAMPVGPIESVLARSLSQNRHLR